ncbi:YecA family protein [Paenibacillus sp. GYB003]|uniref:YecA family protein n=1 Tax=Paenibacillus sp. GYB003 TaxID=2994392 RepID=UPI002F964DAF
MAMLKKMSLDALGRNDPCLCGSGNKFKKCCLNKPESERRLHFEDMNTPRVNDWFFHYHPLQELTAAMLLHADLTMPELQKLASSMTRKMITRGEEEEKQIRAEQNPLVLMEKLSHGTDVINYPLVVDRLLEYEGQVTPFVIQKLRDTDEDVFIEQGVRYLNRVADFPLNEIVELAEKAKSPYVRSSLCVLLGIKGSEAVLPTVWRQYHLLRMQYPSESYMQGPLYGLYEYGYRFGLLKEGDR